MKPSCAARALWFAVCLVAAASADSRAESGLPGYRNPKAVVCGGRVYLFVEVAGAPETPCLCLCQDGEGGWSIACELRADYSCVAHSAGRFYLFLPESVIEGGIDADAKTWKKTGQTRWRFNWRPQSAEFLDETLTAFGVSDGTLYSAALRHRQPEPDAPSSEPARRWLESTIPTTGEGRCVEVRTALVAGKLWLFWTTEEEGGSAQALWAAPYGPGGTSKAAKLAQMDGHIEFAPSALGGKPMVVYAALPARRSGERSLSYRMYAGGVWRPFELATAVVNPVGEQTHELDAAALEGKIHLFVGAGYPLPFMGTIWRVLHSIYDGGAWGAPRTVAANPQFNWVIEHSGALAAVTVVGLLILAASLIRSTFLPHRAVIGGVEYVLATWWRRGGAYLFDLVIALVVGRTVQVLSGRAPGGAETVPLLFVFELFYFSAFEARSGRTLGKRLFGLIVVSRNGGYPGWRQAGLRNLFRATADVVLPLGWMVGSLVLLNTRGAQRVGDLAAGTYVVRQRK